MNAALPREDSDRLRNEQLARERERLAGLERDNAALTTELSARVRVQQEHEREMALAISAGRFGTWSLDLADHTLTASDTCKAIFGIAPAAPFTWQQRRAATHPADRAAADQAMIDSATRGADVDLVHRILLPDGVVRWISTRGQPFYSPEGVALRIAGVSTDVTIDKRSERMKAALIELSDVLREPDQTADLSYRAAEIIGRTLEVSRAGYGVIDLAKETVTIERDWNDVGITTIAGTLAFRDYGSYIDDLKRGETAVVQDARTDPRTVATAAALEAIAARAFVNMPLTEQGGLVALLYLNHALPREWPDDELSFIREVAERTRTAVERRRAEHALAAFAATLEQQVAERTRELLAAEEALRQAQKMEAVGQLTGGLAHDFNNLLTGISGSLELLQMRLAQGRASEADRFVNVAQSSARRAAAITNRLLAFSRRQTLAPTPTNVNRLVIGMEELIRRTIGPSIQLESALYAGLWLSLVDQSQLENSILNLCINARDAMPAGGKITIETANRWIDHTIARERGVDPGQYVSLGVSDTGTGMTPAVIEKAFEPFFTTKPIGVGTGLGLSMVYGFARQSGGQVRIYSEVGQGSNVCIYLPRHHGDDTRAPAPIESSVPARAQAGQSVLIVEDDHAVRMLVVELLSDLGYAAVEAVDGPMALRKLDTGVRVDLLVTDVGLPNGMNGRQVADAARVSRPDLKVLFITGFAENAVLSHGHLDPGMHVLTKPFTIDALAGRIKELIGGN